MEIKNITLDGWKIFSDRVNSRNYTNEDETKLLKIFAGQSKMNEKQLVKEKEISDAIYKLGVRTPRTYEIVKAGEEFGVICEYIKNKRSIARALGTDYENKERYLTVFANFAKEIHSTKCDTDFFPNVEDCIRNGLKAATFLTPEEMKNINALIDSVEKQDCCLIKDFQFSNVIITLEDIPYAIDLGTFSYGNPIWDLSFLYFFTHFMHPHVIESVLHIKPEQAAVCWDIFIEKYYSEKSASEMQEIVEKIKKLSFISMFSMVEELNVIKELSIMKEMCFKDTYK